MNAAYTTATNTKDRMRELAYAIINESEKPEKMDSLAHRIKGAFDAVYQLTCQAEGARLFRTAEALRGTLQAIHDAIGLADGGEVSEASEVSA
jgi:hypothetical protein